MEKMEVGDLVKVKDPGWAVGSFGVIEKFDTPEHDCCVYVRLDSDSELQFLGVSSIEPAVDLEYQDAVNLFGEEYFA